MEYPEQIICHSSYKEKIPLESLNTNDFCVSRRIDGKLEDCIEKQAGRDLLDPDCLGVIVRMSVNLMGGLFLPEHTLFIQEGDGKKPWDGVREIKIDEFPDCYRLHEGDFVFYRASLLHNATYPHEIQMKNKGQYNAYHEAVDKEIEKEFKDGIITKVSVTLELVSMPTNLNYWHLEMKTELTESKKELKNAESYRKLIFNHILNHILCKEFLYKDMTTGIITPDVYARTA